MAIAAVLALAVGQAHATVQPQMFCWDPDVEFPVACYDPVEGDEARHS